MSLAFHVKRENIHLNDFFFFNHSKLTLYTDCCSELVESCSWLQALCKILAGYEMKQVRRNSDTENSGGIYYHSFTIHPFGGLYSTVGTHEPGQLEKIDKSEC